MGFVVYGFKYRFKQKEDMKQAVVTQVSASDAATSTRPMQHPPDPSLIPASSLNGQPGTNTLGMPNSTVWNAANAGLNQIKGAVVTVAHPFPDNQQAQYSQTPYAYNPPPQYAQAATPDPVATLKTQMAAREMERRQRAIEAPIMGGQNGANTQSANQPDQIQTDLARLAALSNGGSVPPMSATPMTPNYPAGNGPHRNEEYDQNEQSQKRAFQSTDEGEYVQSARVAPISPWVIEKGDKIIAGLPNRLVSDLPGDLECEVVSDVYDTPTHRFILIPAGSILTGEYNSSVTYGQGRAQAVWNYLRFPDGSFIDGLGKFPSHDADGSSGLSDQVDGHYKRLIGGVLLSAAFAAGLEISQNRNSPNSTLAYPSTGQVATSAIAQQAGTVGQQITQRNLNVQPTVKIRPGKTFQISVMKSIVLPGPYEAIKLLPGQRKGSQ